MSLYSVRFLNIGMRGILILCRFSLVFILSYYLSIEDVADFGLIVAFLSYMTFVCGLDFYQYSSREFFVNDKNVVISNTIAIYVFSYLLVSFLLFLFSEYLSFNKYLLILVPILIFEHLSQELSRFSVIQGRVLHGTVITFFRSGIWVIFVAVGFFFANYNELLFVLKVWLFGSFLAFIVGVYFNFSVFSTLRLNISLAWIYNGVKVSLFILFGTLIYRSIFLLDRLFIDFTLPKEYLASYVVYFSLGTVIVSFIDAGVLSFIQKDILKAASNNEYLKIKKSIKKAIIDIIFISSFMAIVIVYSSDYLFDFLGKDEYKFYSNILPLVLLSNVFNSLARAINFGLYSAKKDRNIVLCNFLGMFIVLVSFFISWLFNIHVNVYFVPIIVLITNASIFFSKFICFNVFIKSQL